MILSCNGPRVQERGVKMLTGTDYIKTINSKPSEWQQAFRKLMETTEGATQDQIMQAVDCLKNLMKNK